MLNSSHQISAIASFNKKYNDFIHENTSFFKEAGPSSILYQLESGPLPTTWVSPILDSDCVSAGSSFDFD
jgi:hypothetical protein